MGSVGQRASKLLAVKVGGLKKKSAVWPRPHSNQLAWVRGGPGSNHSQSLTDGNFAALWPTDPKFLELKDLSRLKKRTKNQVASSILKVVFAFSKWRHLHRAYLLASRFIWPALYFVEQGIGMWIWAKLKRQLIFWCWSSWKWWMTMFANCTLGRGHKRSLTQFFFMNCYGFLLLTNRFVLKHFFVKHKWSSSNKSFPESLWYFAFEQ